MSSVPRANATVYHRKIDFDVTYRTGPGRDRVVPGRPPVGERWALFGGSFAFGWGLDDAESIAGRLQAANPEARVFNHAMRGHGTADVYIRLQRELADNPDTRLCVYLLIADHLRRTACPDSLTAQSWGLRKPRFTLNNGRPLFLGHAAGTLSLPSQVNVSLLRRSRLYARLYPKWQPSSEALELTASLIRAMNKACESTPGCRFLLVHLPLERAYFDTCVGWDRGALQEWLSALAADGVTVLDCAAKLSAHLAETGDPEQDFYFADRHPNARYADLVAGWVDEFLSEGRVLPADPDDRG